MKTILLSGAISMIIALIGTKPTITVLRKRKLGQQIRSDGPQAHLGKSGTPTMGGIIIIIASLLGYVIGHLLTNDPMTASGVLVLFLMTGLGLVGFADDFIKLFMRRSLGLRSGAKLAGQATVGVIFAVLALHFPDGYDLTPASSHISFLADFGISIGPILFVLWVLLMVTGASNGVNLTDGLDGLASGASILVLAAYVIIGNWQLRNDCTTALTPNCYDVRDPLDAAVVAAVVMGACFGFLWWNAPPAKIFMGDTGSLALGGALAGLAIVTRTELAAAAARRAVRDHHAVGGHPGRLLQDDPQARLPHGAAPASLRAGGLGRDDDRRALLADRGHVRRPGPRHLLRRLVPQVTAIPDARPSKHCSRSARMSLAGSMPADIRISAGGSGLPGPPGAPLPDRLHAAEAGSGHDEPCRRHDRVRVGGAAGPPSGPASSKDSSGPPPSGIWERATSRVAADMPG